VDYSYLLDLALLQQGVNFTTGLSFNSEVRHHFAYFLSIGPPGYRLLLSSPHLGSGNHLHSLANLGDALNTAYPPTKNLCTDHYSSTKSKIKFTIHF
jgi:hypothetical protein